MITRSGSFSGFTKVHRRMGFLLAWLLWTAMIIAIVFPWHDLADHTHWRKVAWIPFISPPLTTSDIVANVLVYIPFGYLGARASERPWQGAAVVGVATLLSIASETSQLYSHWRFPSTTDVICNFSGCLAGIYFARSSSWRASFPVSQEISS